MMIGKAKIKKFKICLLEKKRGNFLIQEKFDKNNSVIDTTNQELEHHFNALNEAGYEVIRVKWNEKIITNLRKLDADLIFNVSSIVEASILDELEMPYVGSDIIGCVIATDKVIAKDIWIKNKLPTSPYVLAKSVDDCRIFEESKPFDYPLFIKPSRGRGSSGIDDSSLIHNYDELIKEVKKRLDLIGQPVLIERFLQGREITCGIIGNGNRIRALPLLEIKHNGINNFLTFNKKEIDDDKLICPAPLSEKETKILKELAISAFKSTGLRDYGRVDMILSDDKPFLLEINSFAGLMCTPKEKPHSYMGFMAVAENITGSEFLDEIIKEALIRVGKISSETKI
jgi:D-alanine-D-alanine ligase